MLNRRPLFTTAPSWKSINHNHCHTITTLYIGLKIPGLDIILLRLSLYKQDGNIVHPQYATINLFAFLIKLNIFNK